MAYDGEKDLEMFCFFLDDVYVIWLPVTTVTELILCFLIQCYVLALF